MDVERLDDLRELIGEYWCLAFAEGQEGRSTDTPDGAAQKCLSAIESIIREARAALTPPEEPDHALLVSMAMCLRHGFGLDTPEQQQSQLREMRKLWDEVMGRGYYSPDNRERYVAMLAARPEVP